LNALSNLFKMNVLNNIQSKYPAGSKEWYEEIIIHGYSRRQITNYLHRAKSFASKKLRPNSEILIKEKRIPPGWIRDWDESMNNFISKEGLIVHKIEYYTGSIVIKTNHEYSAIRIHYFPIIPSCIEIIRY